LVWANSNALGCGAKRCDQMQNLPPENKDAVFLVCDYGPGWAAVSTN